MFHSVTVSGTDSFIAIIFGTPTSFRSTLGSGLITVLAEKLVLFPARLCLILPSLLFILSVSVLSGWPLLCLAGGSCTMLLSKNVVMWYWSKSHKSSMIISGAPALMFSNSLWLILTMSPILCVRSSSLLSPLSSVMLGLIVTGGIGRTVSTVHSGLINSGLMPNSQQSSSGIFSSLVLISTGLTLLSPSISVAGFSRVIFCCLALQCGHLFEVFVDWIISFILSLLALMPFSASISFSDCKYLPSLFLGTRILPQSLHVDLSRFNTREVNLTWMIGLASSI